MTAGVQVVFDEAAYRATLAERERKTLGAPDRAPSDLDLAKLQRPEADEEPVAPREWPAPLERAAFHGLAGEFVRGVEPYTEADPAALLLSFLVAFGNALGRGPYVQVEADRHHANLFGVLVGVTGRGRKGTSWGHVRRVFDEADSDWSANRIVGGLSSGEGLIHLVRDASSKQEAIREPRTRLVTGYQTVTEDAGVSDKRLLAIETEFASVLKVMNREGQILSEIVRQAWDRGDLRIASRNTAARATGAHMSLLGHVTAAELASQLDRVEAANGFLNRILLVAVRRSKLLPEGGDVPTAAIVQVAGGVVGAFSAVRAFGRVERDGPARALWADAYPSLSEGRAGLLGAALSRAEAQVTRLSLVYALLDSSRAIRRVHLEAALAVWAYVEASTAYVLGDTLGNPIADKIEAAVRATPEGLDLTELSSLFSRHVSSSVLSSALTLLLESLRLEKVVEETGGRPRTRYRQKAKEAKKAEEGGGEGTSCASSAEPCEESWGA